MRPNRTGADITWAEFLAHMLCFFFPFLCIANDGWRHLVGREGLRWMAIASCLPSSALLLVYIWRDVRARRMETPRLFLIAICLTAGWCGVGALSESRGGKDFSRVRR